MHFKIIQEGAKLSIAIDQVAYIGLFLIGRALEQFKPYFTKVQINNIMSTNLEVKYLFLSQGGFIERLTQMFGDLEVTTIIERKL